MGLLNRTYYTTLLRFFILIVTAFFFNFIYACTWTTTGVSSNWTNASAWTKSGSGCGAATYPSTTSINTGDVIIINHTMSLTSGTYVVKAGGTLTINSPATFTITGNIDLNNGSFFQLNSGANLSVSGNFNNSNNSTNVTVNGSVNVGGNLTAGNGSAITSTTSSGSFTVQGSISGPGSIFGSSISCADQALPCLTSSIAPLPIEFISAGLECQDNGVRLEWSTNSEFNNDFFTVETSREGSNWNTYSTIASLGNSNQIKNYSLDIQGVNNYVRLVQTDKDGKQEILSILSVNCSDKDSKILLYPNPTTDYVHVDITNLEASESKNAEILISDMFGNVIGRELIQETKKVYSFRFDTVTVAPGMYSVSINGMESISPQHFIAR